MFKKFLAVVLSASIVLSTSVVCFASSETQKIDGKNVEVTVIKDTETERVVKATVGEETSYSTYDKTTGVSIVKTGDKVVTINPSAIKPETPKDLTSKGGYTVDELSSGDHGYVVKNGGGNSYYWDCRIKYESFTDKREVKGENDVLLNTFRTKVRDLHNKKLQIAASGGTGALSLISGLIAGAPATGGTSAIVALLVGAGLGLTTAYLGAELYGLQCDADYTFRRISTL